MDQMKAQWRVLVLVASFKDELFGLSTIWDIREYIAFKAERTIMRDNAPSYTSKYSTA